MSSDTNVIVANNFHPPTLSKMEKKFRLHHLWKLDEASRKECVDSLSGRCHFAVTASWSCDEEIYDLESLRLISAFGVGVDGINFDRTQAQGIRVSNTPDVLNDAVAELAIGLMVASTREIIAADQFARTNKWLEGPFRLGSSLKGKTLGILGLGSIGQSVAKRITPFGVSIAYHNRSQFDSQYQYCPTIIELAEVSDVLLCLLPGGANTNQLVNGAVFDALGPNGIFINLGRGNSVEENDLINAVAKKKIKLACLDVYENEPHISEALRSLENVILLPHIGSATVETRTKMGDLVIRNIEAFLENEQLVSEVFA